MTKINIQGFRTTESTEYTQLDLLDDQASNMYPWTSDRAENASVLRARSFWRRDFSLLADLIDFGEKVRVSNYQCGPVQDNCRF